MRHTTDGGRDGRTSARSSVARVSHDASATNRARALGRRASHHTTESRAPVAPGRNDPAEPPHRIGVIRAAALDRRVVAHTSLPDAPRFFRDPAAWEDLGALAIAPLLAAQPAGQPLRVWVAGCGTGEDAYTLAMLLLERIDVVASRCALQIFATDADGAAVDVGRAGLYPDRIAADLTPERLARFFVRERGGYRVTTRLRRAVVFGRHDLVAEPPLARLHLISCRDVIAYLDPPNQDRVRALLHSRLVDGGYLLLGEADSIGSHGDGFERVSSRSPIYRRIASPRAPDRASPKRTTAGAAGTPTARARNRVRRDGLFRAALLVNARGDILDRAGAAATSPAHRGRRRRNVFARLPVAARAALRAALRQAAREGAAIRSVVRVVPPPGRRGVAAHPLRISVDTVSFDDARSGAFLVSFDDEPGDPSHPAVDRRLDASRDQLRQLGRSNAELRTRARELVAMVDDLGWVLDGSHDGIERLLSSAPATVVLDTELRIRRFTTPATRLLALTPSDVGRPLADVAQTFAARDLVRDARAVVEGFVPARKEVRADDGRWYLRETLPYRRSDGRLDGVVIMFDAAWDTVEDDRLRAEAIVETVHEGLIVLDASLRVVAANPASCELLMEDPAAVGQKALSAVGRGALDVPALRAALERALANGTATDEIEVPCQLPHRGRRVLRIRARPLKRAAKRRPSSILVVIEDVTKQKEQEAAVKESAATTRAILAATADAIVTTDARGVIRTWNAATERIFRHTGAELAGSTLATLTSPPDDDAEREPGTRRCPRTGIPHVVGRRIEVVGRRNDGTTFPVELLVSELHHGKAHFVAIMRDITDRKEAETAERRHQAELARVRRANFAGELGVSIAHEVNQPLTTVTTTLAACAMKMRQGKASRTEILALLGRATKEALRAAQIVRQLRDLARGRVVMREKIDLRKTIRSVLAFVAGQLEKDGVALHVVLGNAPLPVRASSLELEHVVMNLVYNAADSVRERGAGARDVTVSAAPSADGTAVEVAVRDTGVGIPAASVEKLFEAFFTTKPDGFGMGLAICRSIIEAHGGRIWIAPGENRPGATTIRFAIPLDSPAAHSPARRPTAR